MYCFNLRHGDWESGRVNFKVCNLGDITLPNGGVLR